MSLFARTDEHRLLAENLERLLTRANPCEQRRLQRDVPGGGRSDLWRELAELGVLAAAIGESHGGLAGDARTIAVVMEQLGAGLALEPFVECAVVAGRVLQGMPGEAARAALERVIDGRDVVVVAHPFSAVSGDGGVQPLLSVNDGVRITGALRCIRHAPMADAYLMPLGSGDGSMQIVRLARDTPGLRLDAFRLIDGAYAADIHLDGTEITAAMQVPCTGDPAVLLRDALDLGLLGSVAEGVGVLARLNAATFAYLKDRKQFGVAIASFQALQHRAADMHIAVEEAIAMADAAIEYCLAHGPSAQRSSVLAAAKVCADRAGRVVGNDAVQLHGGMGVSDELSVSHYVRRLVAMRSEYGTCDAHLLGHQATP